MTDAEFAAAAGPDGKVRFTWLTGVRSLPVFAVVLDGNTLKTVELYPGKSYANATEAMLDPARRAAEATAKRLEALTMMEFMAHPEPKRAPWWRRLFAWGHIYNTDPEGHGPSGQAGAMGGDQ